MNLSFLLGNITSEYTTKVNFFFVNKEKIYVAMKRSVKTWLNLTNIMLHERNQTQKVYTV